MRILIAVPLGARLGGAEEMLQMAIEGAGERGHEVEFAFLAPGPWPAELAAAGYPVEVIDAGRLRDLHRWPATVARLARLMRRRQPDLILDWMTKAHYYGAPAAALAGMGERVLWWQHGIPERHWSDRWATLLPALAIGCSSAGAARAQERLRPSRPTFVVAPGARVPDGERARAALEIPAGVTVIGLVARLQAWKGQDRLLEAHALLRERGHRIHTVLVGGDAHGLSPAYARSLPALIGRLGLSDSVTMTGQVKDAGPYIELMDVLVNASDAEPFGIVLLEGMARGVPVVAVGSGGPAEIIDHARTGMLAGSPEPAALADALEPLLSSPELRQSLGRAGRERFMREYTPAALRQRFFDQLEALKPRAASARPARTLSGSGADDSTALG